MSQHPLLKAIDESYQRTDMPDYRAYIHTGSLRTVKPDAVKSTW